MPSLMEEVRGMMPGRARSNWSLTEASESSDFEYESQQVQDMVGRLNKAQSRFHAELKRLSGYDGWESYDAAMTHGRVFAPFGTFARINFILNHTDKKIGVIRMYRVTLQVSPQHQGTSGVREVYLQVHGTIRSQKDLPAREKDVEFNKTFSFDLGKGAKSDRYDDPKVVLAKAKAVFDGANKMMPKGMGEDVAGAPGPFAISDEGSVRDEVEDLLDRVRSPRWEYPSWVLPKEDLVEAAPSKQTLLKAMQAYLGAADGAPMKVQQRLYDAVMKIVQQFAEHYKMTPTDVWSQAEDAARAKGITKAMPGKDF